MNIDYPETTVSEKKLHKEYLIPEKKAAVQGVIQAITDLDNHFTANEEVFGALIEDRKRENVEIVRLLSGLHYGDQPNPRELHSKLLILTQWLEQNPKLQPQPVEGLTILNRIQANVAKANELNAFTIDTPQITR